MGLFDIFRKKNDQTDRKETPVDPQPPAAGSAPVFPDASIEDRPLPGSASVTPAAEKTKDLEQTEKPSQPAEEPLYKGVYRMGVEYLMGFNPKKDIYFIEVHDNTGMLLNDDPSEHMFGEGQVYIAVFALTKDEYDLRYNGAPATNNPEINGLLDKLLQNLPKDRFVSSLKIDPQTKDRLRANLQTKCETMDNNKYKVYQSARAIDHLKAQDHVFVIQSNCMGGLYPAINTKGQVLVFDSEEAADAFCKANPNMNLSVRSFSQERFRLYVRRWYGLGITRIWLNPTGEGIYGEIERDDFLPDPKAKKWDHYGSSLNQLILRFQQALNSKEKGADVTAHTWWDAICHTLPNTLLLVPISFDGEPDDAEDMTLHLTRGAVNLMTKLKVQKETGSAPSPNVTLVAESEDGQPLLLGDIDLFYGSEGYSFAEGKAGRIMHLRTVVNRNRSTALCAFTNFETLRGIFPGKLRIGVFTFDEIIEHMNDPVDTGDGKIHGFVINPGSIQLGLEQKDIDAVNRIRKEQPKIYVIGKDEAKAG